MQNARFWIALILLLAIASIGLAAEWAKVLIHTHPDSPDTLKMPPAKLMQAAVEFGYDALIVTDHHAQLRAKENYAEYKVKFAHPPQTKAGRPLVVILGAEILTKDGSHILAMNLNSWPDNIVDQPQQTLLNNLAKMGTLTVAAHPFNTNYKLKYDALNNLNGLELFNDAKIQPGGRYKDTMDFAMSMLRQGKSFWFTSGSDLHGYPEIRDERMTRATYVRVNDFTAKDILVGLRAGQTYISQHTVRFSDPETVLTNIPTNPPHFQFDLNIDYAATNDKKVQIYRDGSLVNDSIVTLKKGQAGYNYDWTDAKAPAGRHSYIIEVVDCLVTSPIWLDVAKTESETVPLPKPKPSENLVRRFYQKTLVQQTNQIYNDYGYLGQGYLRHDYNPAPRATTDFPMPSGVEIYVIFKNNEDFSRPPTDITIYFNYQLISPSGEVLDAGGGRIGIEGWWHTSWYVFGRPLREKGDYTIKIFDQKNTLLDRKVITLW